MRVGGGETRCQSGVNSVNGLPSRATQRRSKPRAAWEGVETIITRLPRGTAKAWSRPRTACAGGESRSGKHNLLVLDSNPSRPTIQFTKSSVSVPNLCPEETQNVGIIRGDYSRGESALEIGA